MLSFIFDSAGMGEWVLFMAIVLIVVGPKRLPEAARKLGKIMSEIKRAAQSFKDEVMKLDEPVEAIRREIPDETGDPLDDSTSGAEDGESSTEETYGPYGLRDYHYPDGYSEPGGPEDDSDPASYEGGPIDDVPAGTSAGTEGGAKAAEAAPDGEKPKGAAE